MSRPVDDVAVGAALRREPGILLGVIFGSVARGTEGTASDLDVAVLAESGVDLPLALGVALERVTGRSVDLIDLRTAPPLLRFEVAREGRVVFERRPHAWSDFRARAMVDWWDWAPLARRMHRAAVARLRACAVMPPVEGG